MKDKKVKKEKKAIITFCMEPALANVIKTNAEKEKRNISNYLSIVLSELYKDELKKEE